MFMLLYLDKKVLAKKINLIVIIHVTGVKNCKKFVRYD
jgi:hypothetical protein